MRFGSGPLLTRRGLSVLTGLSLGLAAGPAWAMQPCPAGTHPSYWGHLIAAIIVLISFGITFAMWTEQATVKAKIGALSIALMGVFAALVFWSFWSLIGPCV